jgi:hypothetical protein
MPVLYEHAYRDAEAFSVGLVLLNRRADIVHGPASARYLNPDADQAFAALLLRTLGEPPDIMRLARQCLRVHSMLAPDVAALVEVTPMLTVGDVCLGADLKAYHVTQDDIVRWVERGPDDPYTADFHAWLTPPSMEIIDFTLLATISYIERHKTDNRIEFGVIAKHYTELRGLDYEPIAVGGPGLLERLGFSTAIVLRL